MSMKRCVCVYVCVGARTRARVCARACHWQWQWAFVTRWLNYWPRQEVLYMLKNRLYLFTPVSVWGINKPEQARLINESSELLDMMSKDTLITDVLLRSLQHHHFLSPRSLCPQNKYSHCCVHKRAIKPRKKSVLEAYLSAVNPFKRLYYVSAIHEWFISF